MNKLRRMFDYVTEIVVRGGDISEATDSYIHLIKKRAIANSHYSYCSVVRIKRAHLEMKTALMGNAYYNLVRLAGRTL